MITISDGRIIADKELGSGSRCADIRVLNGLTSNAIRVGMKLLIP